MEWQKTLTIEQQIEQVGPVGRVARGLVQPIGRNRVRLEDGLFEEWRLRNRNVTIPHGIANLEQAGNLENLRRLAGESDASFTGMLFADSDVYKVLEGIAWELGREDDDSLRGFYFETVALLERAQRHDGYLDSAYQLEVGDRTPWSDFVHGHELYCLGHLIQAGIAGKRAIGDDRLLGVAQRFVQLVVELFGSDDSSAYCGHPEIEMALVELFRLTGDGAALDLAEKFVRRRGSGFIGEGVYGSQYYQDDTPVATTEIMRGHAVRAIYLNSAATDLVLEGHGSGLLAAVTAQWNDLLANRMYVTGGTGSRHRDEAFGDAYELPSERAYSETCAGIAMMGWGWRMYLATAEAHYIDVFETNLYNVVLAGVSLSGDAFFYSNPLQRRADHGSSQQESAGVRLPWYSCACCPPNLMRTFASLDGYLAAEREGETQVVNFATATIALDGGASVSLATEYPAAGMVTATVSGSISGHTLAFRVPGWAAGRPTVSVDGVPQDAQVDKGWLRIEDAIVDGRQITLEFSMEPIALYPHPGMDGARGTLAVRRGPIVYCIDQADNNADVENLEIVTTEFRASSTGSTEFGPLLEAVAEQISSPLNTLPLYSLSPAEAYSRSPLPEPAVLRPYASWGNGAHVGAMRVWIPRSVDSANPARASPLGQGSAHTPQ